MPAAARRALTIEVTGDTAKEIEDKAKEKGRDFFGQDVQIRAYTASEWMRGEQKYAATVTVEARNGHTTDEEESDGEA